jgi:hypothetical protein
LLFISGACYTEWYSFDADDNTRVITRRTFGNLNLDQEYVPTTLDKIYEIALYEEGDSVEYAREPFPVTFDLSDSNISADDFNNIYGIRYSGDEIKEYIHGTYNQDNKTFTFHIDSPGDYAVNIAKNTTRLNLTIGSTSYTVNNSPKTLDSEPIIVDNRTLVPVRAIVEDFGAQVEWYEDTKSAVIAYKRIKLTLTIGQSVSGMDVPARIIKGRIMVPLRYISENFGANVIYDDETKSIAIVVIEG